MSVSVQRRRGAVVARIVGDMDLSTADEIRTLLDREIDLGCRHLVLNLGRVSFIDSSGLGVILGRYRRLAAMGGRLVLVGVGDRLLPVLDLSGVLNLLPVRQSESEVVRGG